MDKEFIKPITQGLEVVVDNFKVIGRKLNCSFYQEKAGLITKWNADIFLTKNNNEFFFTQYYNDSSLLKNPNNRDFRSSVLYRIINNKMQNYANVRGAFPINLLNPLSLFLIRGAFNEHEGEREMNSFDLSVGKVKFGVYGSHVGDKIKEAMLYTGALIPMKIRGLGAKIKTKQFYEGDNPLFWEKRIIGKNLPPGFAEI